MGKEKEEDVKKYENNVIVKILNQKLPAIQTNEQPSDDEGVKMNKKL